MRTSRSRRPCLRPTCSSVTRSRSRSLRSTVGPNPATDIEITESLPAGFDFVSASASQGTYDPATGAWSVGSLADGETAQLVLTATVTAPGAITNLAVKTGQNEPDPIVGNDSAAARTTATPAADLEVDKEVDRHDALGGRDADLHRSCHESRTESGDGHHDRGCVARWPLVCFSCPVAGLVRHGDWHLDGRIAGSACAGDAHAGGNGRPTRRAHEQRHRGVAGPDRSEPAQQQRGRIRQCRTCGRPSGGQGREQSRHRASEHS